MKTIVCVVVIGLIVPSFAGAAIQDIQVSNNNFVAVTISWTTGNRVLGEVHYSENQNLASLKTAYDVRGRSFSGCTHYVEITGLTNETTYYFEVVAGGETDNNQGNYYTFRTMKQPESPPTPCTITGCVYEEDGTTRAVGSMVYLQVTHGGVASYPLSDLLGSPGDATPGCFAFDIKQARSAATDDLFPSIDPGDPIHVEVIDCGNYRADGGLVFDECFSSIEYLTLAYTPTGTTTTSTRATTPSTPTTTTSTPEGGCTTDAACDDGVYCNGAETCDPGTGCQPGSNPCGENALCSEEDDTCKPAMSFEASINGCGFPLFARAGVVEIQGLGTDFKSLSVVGYDSPLVIKSRKLLLNRKKQTIRQFVLLMPSIFSPVWEYPAMVTVTVDTLTDTFEIPACGRRYLRGTSPYSSERQK